MDICNEQKTDLIASVLVEDHQHEGHDHYNTDHDDGIEHGVESALTNRLCVLTERSVDPEHREEKQKNNSKELVHF